MPETEAGQITSQAVTALIDQLRETVDQEGLSFTLRLKVVSAVRSAIVPKRKPGRRKEQRLNRAYADYKAQVRGLKLFAEHIPQHDKLSRWQRSVEQRRLMAALQQRASRDKKKRQQRAGPKEQAPRRPSAAGLTIAGPELSGRQFSPGVCQSDSTG